MSKTESIQHSMCMLALTVVEIPFKLYTAEMEEEYNNNLIKTIQDNWKQCYDIVRKRRISKGAMRDLDARCFPLFRLFDDYESSNDSRKFVIWCSFIVLCYHLLLDCRATCHIWWSKGECFDNMCNAIEEFAETIMENYPMIGDDGVALYMKFSF